MITDLQVVFVGQYKTNRDFLFMPVSLLRFVIQTLW